MTFPEPPCDEAADALLVAAVESSADAVITSDRDGVITSWNRGAEALYGYLAEEAVGHPLPDIIFRTSARKEWRARHGLIQRGDSIDNDIVRRRRKDGTEIVVSVTVSPLHLRDGTHVGAVAISRDFTQELATAGALDQVGLERDLLTQAIDSAPVYVMAFDERGVVTCAVTWRPSSVARRGPPARRRSRARCRSRSGWPGPSRPPTARPAG